MSRIVVVVPRTREYCGRLVVLAADGRTRAGPLRVLATASKRVARRHGNPRCDPLRPFGHPPAGGYVVARSLPPGYSHPRRPGRYGLVGGLLLEPKSGDAIASRANGRIVFALHGGPLDPSNRLRPTRGGLRMSDRDLLTLLRAVNDAHADADPIEGLDILEVTESDLSAVPALDLRGARRALGIEHKARDPRGQRVKGSADARLLVLLLGAGAWRAGGRAVGRRDVLKLALLTVGGLAVSACGNGASPCTPLACDPGDMGVEDEGGRLVADAAVAGDGGHDRRDGGRGGGGGDGGKTGGGGPQPCPPSGYVCEDDNGGTYVDTTTGVG